MYFDKLIIDTNLLLLLIIGSLEDGIHIGKSTRLNDYTVDDYDTIVEIIKKSREVYTTPYIATEVSNLIDLNGKLRIQAFKVCQQLFCIFPQAESSVQIDVKEDNFIYYGLTDASLVKLAQNHYILTADNKLLPALYESCAENILPYKLIKQQMKG